MEKEPRAGRDRSARGMMGPPISMMDASVSETGWVFMCIYLYLNEWMNENESVPYGHHQSQTMFFFFILVLDDEIINRRKHNSDHSKWNSTVLHLRENLTNSFLNNKQQPKQKKPFFQVVSRPRHIIEGSGWVNRQKIITEVNQTERERMPRREN